MLKISLIVAIVPYLLKMFAASPLIDLLIASKTVSTGYILSSIKHCISYLQVHYITPPLFSSPKKVEILGICRRSPVGRVVPFVVASYLCRYTPQMLP